MNFIQLTLSFVIILLGLMSCKENSGVEGHLSQRAHLEQNLMKR